MKKVLLILFLGAFLFSAGILSAQNHMDIMTTMTGEYNNSRMGWSMTTIDWNGDGYDDLIVNEKMYKPLDWEGLPLGALHIYFGSPNFDNIPEMEMPGNYEIEFVHTDVMCNAGHMNNDQYNDLALFKASRYEGDDNQNYDLQLCVYYGGAYPDSIPDYILTFPREYWDNGISFVSDLGDINYDGFDDIGYAMRPTGFSDPIVFGIIYGGSMENTIFVREGLYNMLGKITGVGDINADGIDDFMIGYYHNIDGIECAKDVLYFGSASGVYNDSLIIADGSNYSANSFPAGDVNEDGIADFVSAYTGSHAQLFFGGHNFNAANYLYLTPPYQGDISGEGFGHGDVNGNGTDDLMGSSFSWSGGGGEAGFWEGGTPMNGGLDLHIDHPWEASRQMFGWCLTMGDYNGDGCCDAAISAPFDYLGSSSWNGKVYIYAGNTDLNDPTGISDDTHIPVVNNGMRLYPNPLQPQQSSLNVRFPQSMTPLPPLSRGDSEESARGDREVSPLDKGGRGVYSSTFEIYNIRGQKVKSYILSAEQAKLGSATYHLHDLSSGVYVCVLSNGKMQNKKKITIIK